MSPTEPHQAAWLRAIVLSTVVLCIVFAVRATGQDKKANSTFATVDVGKISSEYKARGAAEAEIAALRAKFDGRLQRRSNAPLLAEDDHKLLDTLFDKDASTRSAAENTKIQDLNNKGSQLANDFQTLRQKPDKDLTDADKQRIKDTEAILRKAEQTGNALREELEGKLRVANVTALDKLNADIRTAVAKVAEQKGAAIVFDGQLVLYAGQDLTAPVLAELNKK